MPKSIKFIILFLILSVQYTQGSAQENEIKIGQKVEVFNVGGNLNLRKGPGINFAVVTSLQAGAILTVVGGPEISDDYQWWELESPLGNGWAAGEFLQPLSSESNSAIQSSPSIKQFDWRGNLSCKPEQQVYDGLLYCTGIDGANKIVHVLVADLQAPGIAFEYILPEGRSDSYEGELECRDPNVPAWSGPAEGCYVSGNKNLYPVMYLYLPKDEVQKDAIDRAQEVRQSPSLAAVFNADYAASSQTHGPEGLMVVRGDRLDGAENCDDDYNAALRPWLALGNNIDQELGRINAEINRLEIDSTQINPWVYTGIGGGPWLIRDGEIVPGSTTCNSEKVLQILDPIMNCSGNLKPQKNPPISEKYSPGSCRTTWHTAAGLSKDNRWLFLVLSTSERNPETIARFMKNQLGVWQALKFDGGGSSQMLYNPEIPVHIDQIEDDQNIKPRPLTNFIAVYAPEGDGIQLPLEAQPKEKVFYQVISSGETAQIQIEVLNSGSFTWHPDDQVELREEVWFILPSPVNTLPLSSQVKPGDTASWSWEKNTDSFLARRFRMYHKDEPFGPEFAVVIGVLPEDWATNSDELEAQIQEIIDEWESKGEEELDDLVNQIEDWFIAQISNWFKKTLFNLTQSLDELARSGCQNAVIIFGLLMLVVIRHQRYY